MPVPKKAARGSWTSARATIGSSLFPPAFNNRGLQNVAEIQAQCIGHAQADNQAGIALAFFDQPYLHTAHAGDRAELFQGEAPALSLPLQPVHDTGQYFVGFAIIHPLYSEG
jgi:hypothetical protein